MTQEFFEGRTAGVLSTPFSGANEYFAAQRLDGIAMTDASYSHCTFANISFKDVHIDGGSFEDCVFIGCYFRKSRLRNVEFRACRFIDAAFPGLDIADCTFRFPSFRGCMIEFERIESCLPTAPFERYLMTVNLEVQARQAGDVNEARLFRLSSLKAWEGHLLAAIKGEGTYYQEHFPTTRLRAKQLWRYIRSKINGFAWGYGERGWILLRNFLAMSLGLFPLTFFLLRHQFLIEASPPRAPRPEDYFQMSLGNVLPGNWPPDVVDASIALQVVRSFESLLGILMAGMLVSLLLKAVSRR